MISIELVLEKLKKYCAYQDRCHQEVRNKILQYEIYGDDLEFIIAELIQEKFLDEERFARSYARGKFRMKKWGRNRIKMELQQREVSEYCIKKAMDEIEEEEYSEVLKEILLQNIKKNQSLGRVLAVDKAIKYAVKRGYESQRIFKELDVINSDILF